MSLYSEHDLFVLPTLPGEGVPRVLLEAMAAGLPIVTTNVAGIPSLVSHERNGLLVEEPAADAVADAIARIATDAALRRRLIQGGYDTAREHTLQAQASRMLDVVSRRLGLALRDAAVSTA
jgi:glycosyltransferase involved in cell wall biosynthesis